MKECKELKFGRTLATALGIFLLVGFLAAVGLRVSGGEKWMKHLTTEHKAPLDHFIDPGK
jgi:hypothetical protein